MRCKCCGKLVDNLPGDAVAVTCELCTHRRSYSPEMLSKCKTEPVVGLRGRIVSFHWNDPFAVSKAA